MTSWYVRHLVLGGESPQCKARQREGRWEPLHTKTPGLARALTCCATSGRSLALSGPPLEEWVK